MDFQGANLNILLVDDDKMINFINEKLILLIDPKIKINIAENGEQALNYFKDAINCLKKGSEPNFPNLIFLDINMPVMNGWEFLDSLEKFKKDIILKTSIIILSSSINPEEIKRAKGCSLINEYFIKPLTMNQLKGILNSYLFHSI